MAAGVPSSALIHAVLLSAAVWSAPAWAQAPTDASRSEQADQLFADGRALLDQGRYPEACAKFELSANLERSPGTLLNLGNCYELDGDLVRALSTFEEAFMAAQPYADPERRQLWSDAARERIARLGQRVPQLTLRGVEPGSTAWLDGRVVNSAEGGLRVNPGHHVLEARAPGKLSRRQEFDIGVGQHIAIQLQPLEADPASTLAPPPAPPTASPLVVAPAEHPVPLPSPAPARSDASSYGPWPWVLTGTGAALLGASLVTGLTATSKSNRLDRECGGRNCDPSLADLQDSARTLAITTDVLWISGAIAAGVGVTLFVIEHGSEDVDASVRGSCIPGGCSLQAAGRF